MPPDLAPEPEGPNERPRAIVALDAVWVALVTAYVLVAVMGFDRWLLAAGLAVVFAISVGTLRPVLGLLVADDERVRPAVDLREGVAIVVRAVFPRLPPGGPDARGRS